MAANQNICLWWITWPVYKQLAFVGRLRDEGQSRLMCEAQKPSAAVFWTHSTAPTVPRKMLCLRHHIPRPKKVGTRNGRHELSAGRH